MSSKRLERSTSDRTVAGVAAGLASYFGIDPTLVRLLFVAFTLLGGPGLMVYIVLWVVMPETSFGSPTPVDSDEEIIIEKGG